MKGSSADEKNHLNPSERDCPECMGAGLRVVKHPTRPGVRIYQACNAKNAKAKAELPLTDAVLLCQFANFAGFEIQNCLLLGVRVHRRLQRSNLRARRTIPALLPIGLGGSDPKFFFGTRRAELSVTSTSVSLLPMIPP